MYGNKVAEITIPDNLKLLSKLESLDLGYNDLVWLPEDLDQLKALRVLKVMNNFLAKVPMRVCDMDLKTIDVSSNPVTEPPIETCERGICPMRRYWHCIRMEEQSKKKALAEVQKKLQRQTKKSYGRFMSTLRPKCSSTGTTSPTAGLQKSAGSSATDVSTLSTPSSLREDPNLVSIFDSQQIKPPAFASVPKPDPVKYSVSAPMPSSPTLREEISASRRFESKESDVFIEGGTDSMISLALDKVTVNDTL